MVGDWSPTDLATLAVLIVFSVHCFYSTHSVVFLGIRLLQGPCHVRKCQLHADGVGAYCARVHRRSAARQSRCAVAHRGRVGSSETGW